MTKKCPILLKNKNLITSTGPQYMMTTREDIINLENAKRAYGDCLEEKCAWWRKEAFDEKYEHGTKRIYSGHCAILERK